MCFDSLFVVGQQSPLTKMQFFDFQPSIRTVFGENTLDQLASLVTTEGGSRILIVTDPGIVKAGIVDRALYTLKKVSLDAFVFSDVAENPTTRHVQAGVTFAVEIASATHPIDFIIGLGGGSAMDCAKGINFILTNGGRMEDYWGTDKAHPTDVTLHRHPDDSGDGERGAVFRPNRK